MAASPAKVACFRVGENEYALDVLRVREVVKASPLLRVPKAPAFVEGLLELRGKLIPVVDLRKRFELEPGAASQILVVALGDTLAGLIVDRVTEVRRTEPGEVAEPLPEMVTADSRFFPGVVKLADRVLLLVDLDRVLGPRERRELGALSS